MGALTAIVPYLTPPFESQQGGSTGSEATTSASGALQVSDDMVQRVLQNVVPFQGDMSQIIQNRPQLTLPQPIRPHPAQMTQPVTNVNATTEAGQKRNDLNNLLHGIGNIVKAGVNKKREKDDRDLMADLAIIQGAASNPNDPHNKALLDSIASDPKKVKRLQKALGYNPLSGEAMPPETQSLMKGVQSIQDNKAQKGQQIQQLIASKLGPQAAQMPGGTTPQPQQGGAMQNLLSRMPNTPQLNPVVAIQGELIKAGILPKADTSMQAMVSLTKEIMTNDAKYAEIKSKAEASNNRAILSYLASIDKAKNAIELEKMKQQGGKERTEIRAGATTESARIRAKAEVDAANIRAQSVRDRYASTHTTAETAKLDKAIKNIDADIKNLDVQIAAARTAKDSDRVKKLTEEQESRKALKDALEQREIGSQPSPTDLLRNSDSSNEDEMDQEDRIF